MLIGLLRKKRTLSTHSTTKPWNLRQTSRRRHRTSTRRDSGHPDSSHPPCRSGAASAGCRCARVGHVVGTRSRAHARDG